MGYWVMVLAAWSPSGAALSSRHVCALSQVGTHPDVLSFLLVNIIIHLNSLFLFQPRSTGFRAMLIFSHLHYLVIGTILGQ